jgi:hypothetical protein
MQYQFGSIDLMAEVYRQELWADAARSRSVPGVLPASGVSRAASTVRHRLGMLLVHVGQLLQDVQPGTKEGHGPTSSAEVSAIV